MGIKDKYFSEVYTGKSYSLQTMRNQSYFSCVFIDCVFMHTLIDKCRFLGCQFINCFVDKSVILNSVIQIKPSTFKGKCVTNNQDLLRDYSSNFSPHASIGIHSRNIKKKEDLTSNNRSRNKKATRSSRKKAR